MKPETCSIILAAVTALAGSTIGRAETLTLDADSAVRMAIEASTLTLAAEERVEASQSSVKAADASRLPVLSVNATAAYQSAVPEFAAPIDGPGQPPTVIFPNIQTTYSADLSVSQPIFTGGAISANREAAQLDQSATTWSQRLTAIELSNRARLLYWSAVAAAAGVDVAKAQLNRTQRLLGDARALREAGMAVNAEVFAAEARFSAAEVDLIRTRNEEEQSLARLRSLLGIDDGSELSLGDAGTNQIPPSPPALGDLQRTAIEKRHHRRAHRWTRRPGKGGQRTAQTDGSRNGSMARGTPQPAVPPSRGCCQRLMAGRGRGQLAALRRQPDQGAGGHGTRRTTSPAARPK